MKFSFTRNMQVTLISYSRSVGGCRLKLTSGWEMKNQLKSTLIHEISIETHIKLLVEGDSAGRRGIHKNLSLRIGISPHVFSMLLQALHQVLQLKNSTHLVNTVMHGISSLARFGCSIETLAIKSKLNKTCNPIHNRIHKPS